MNEVEFAIWLKNNQVPYKVCSDYISRIKRIERAIKDCDIDDEYAKDGCNSLLSLFLHTGRNKDMQERLIGNLPIGKYYLAAYSYAIRKYIEFKNVSTNLSQK